MTTRVLLQITILSGIVYVFSCKAFPCKSYVNQTHKFGRFPLEFTAPARGLKVGDTLLVKMSVPLRTYDSLTRADVLVQGTIDVFLPLTRHTLQRYDTSFIYVANRYVTIAVVKGAQKDPYTFSLVRESTGWQLLLRYIFKQPMAYYVQPSFRTFDIGEAREQNNVCIEGDPNYNATVQVITSVNQINTINQRLGLTPANEQEVFGFEVR